ncbi:transposase [Mesobacillus maritimus]|uniref:transposase n=1 Tax=Mesobacillus maritimus TaxID=1643336 RepID=UPI00384D05D6
MVFLIIAGSIITPLLMFGLRTYWEQSRLFLNLLAIICVLLFGIIAALAILEIIKDNTVFMTNIHGLFLNPVFLLTSAYIGVYILYRLVVLTFDETVKKER